MKKPTLLLSLICAVLMSGCALNTNSIIVSTGTVLGVKVAQNPTTQLYQAELGFSRAEFGYIPNQTNGTDVANVIMEVKYNNLFTGGGLFQRLAVGSVAVTQPGAAVMFAKDSNGNLSVTNLNTVQKLLLERPQH